MSTDRSDGGQTLGDKRVWVATCAVVFLYTVFFGYLVAQKSQMLQNADDFPQYLQALWSILHDRPFATTWRDVGGAGGSLLGMHLELTLGLLAPLYAVAPDPAVLVVVQVAAVALAAIPIAVCATRLLGSPVYGFLFAVAHLANPYLQRALFYDFHPESIQFLAVTTAASFLLLERYRWFLVFAIFACLTKEDSGVHIFVLGLYAWLAQGRRRLGVATMAGALASVAIGAGLLVPWFRGDTSGYPAFAGKFPALGHDLQTIVGTLVMDPVKVLGIIWHPDNFPIVLWVLLPVAFLPMLSWRAVLLIAPAVALLCLTQSERLKTLSVLYAFSVLPLFPFAAIIGLRDSSGAVWKEWRGRVRVSGALAVAALSLCAMVGYGPTEVRDVDAFQVYYMERFPLGRGFSWEFFRDNEHARTGRRFLRERVPASAPLAVEYRLASHVANRQILRPLSEAPVEDWLLFDLYGPPYSESVDLYRGLLSSPDYGVVAFQDGYTLMGRAAPREANEWVLALSKNRHEAETLRSTTGSNVADHREASGWARHGKAGLHPRGLLVRGLYVTLEAGDHEVAFEMRRGEQTANKVAPIAIVEVFTAKMRTSLVRRPLRGGELRESYRSVRVPLRLTMPGRVEVRVSFASVEDLWLDRIDIRRSSDGAEPSNVVRMRSENDGRGPG